LVQAAAVASAGVSLALVTARAIAAPPAPPPPVTPVAPQCDIRQVDWKNFAYPDYRLTKGSTPRDPQLGEGWGADLDGAHVLYADLDKNGKVEAFVPVENHTPESEALDLWVYETDAQCRPKLVFKNEPSTYAHAGTIVGDRYVFERVKDLFDQRKFRVEVGYVGGRFVEAARW